MKLFSHSQFLMLIGLSAGMVLGCKPSQSTNERYEAAWEKVVQSEAWEDALVSQPEAEFIADSDGDWLVNDAAAGKNKDPFNRSYDSWVNQAYFKIISEAEAADSKIKAEWDRFMIENPEAASSSDENVRKIMALYEKKYKSHKIMLEGLKSWNSFENYGSDDLVFFKAEYENIVRAMYRDGRPEKDIVGYLVYKLADLYHLDEGLIVD